MMNIKRYGTDKNYGIDRISSLPDDAREHILSFLSTREVVQTCILSKRWRNTWASVPDLKFYMEDFGLPEIFEEDMAVEFVTKFELLVKSVLEKRETSCVNKFQLLLDSDFCLPWTQAFADCIGDVMKLEPRECLIHVDSSENLKLNTDLIFTCTSLIDLHLFLSTKVVRSKVIKINSVNLPCLKTLLLAGVIFSDDSFKQLLLGCPMLEQLVLAKYFIWNPEICSKSLKKLEVYNINGGMKLQISTSNLLYLDIKVVVVEEIMLLNMPLLVDASISIPGWYDQDKYVTRGPKLIHNLSNVESLRLDLGCPKLRKVQKKDFSSCPVFNNLKRLELVSWGFYVFDLPPYFLHHSPKLQELTLEYEHPPLFREILDEETTQVGPRDALVQREFLKTVRIVGFENDNELVDRLINKLLAHVKIIGEIIV